MRLLCCMLAVLAILGSSSRWAAAQNANPGLTLDKVISPKLALGATAILQVNGLNAAATSAPKLTDFVLYLDHYPVADGADPQLTNFTENQVAFSLQRTSANAEAWKALLGSPTSFDKTVQVDVGIKGQSGVLPLAPNGSNSATLSVVRGPGLVIAVVGFGILLLVAGLICISRKKALGDLLRDSQPSTFGTVDNDAKLRRPYSLAQTQMFWWFVLVIGAYIFLLLITGEVNTLTPQALTLMGIGTGTALGAAMVENAKTDPVQKDFQDTLAAITQMEAANPAPPGLEAACQKRDRLAKQLASKNFFDDTLTDASGISLHRVQLMAWTVVIGLIFCFQVYQNLTLPAFDSTILALIGISGGTYLGFKVPEQPT